MQTAAAALWEGQGVQARSGPSDADATDPIAAEQSDAAAIRQGAWLQAVARGDQRAFEALYDDTLPRVFALVRRICIDPALAEEVVEDAYVQAWREAGRYDTRRGAPVAWLLTIARSRALDALRRREPAQVVPEPHALVPDPETSADPLDLLLLFESASATHRALASLAPRERQMIGLAFLRGMTHAEIAAETGWPLGSVKTTIRRALATMRRILFQHAPPGAFAEDDEGDHGLAN